MSRHSRTDVLEASTCVIGDEELIPHDKHQQLLANKDLKGMLIKYLVRYLKNKALHNNLPCQLIIATEFTSNPISIYSESEVSVLTLKNAHGEADYNVWLHAISSLSRNILVIGSDTDIWVYGMALKEAGWLHGKTVYVERDVNKEFVDMYTGLYDSVTP